MVIRNAQVGRFCLFIGVGIGIGIGIDKTFIEALRSRKVPSSFIPMNLKGFAGVVEWPTAPLAFFLHIY